MREEVEEEEEEEGRIAFESTARGRSFGILLLLLY